MYRSSKFSGLLYKIRRRFFKCIVVHHNRPAFLPHTTESVRGSSTQQSRADIYLASKLEQAAQHYLQHPGALPATLCTLNEMSSSECYAKTKRI